MNPKWDLALHHLSPGTRGYLAAQRYRVNDRGIETWRIRLPALTDQQHETIRLASTMDLRAIGYRARRRVHQARMFA